MSELPRQVDAEGHRFALWSAALEPAAMLAGCGGMADAGAAVVSGAEAVGTLVKKAMDGEGEDTPAKPE